MFVKIYTKCSEEFSSLRTSLTHFNDLIYRSKGEIIILQILSFASSEQPRLLILHCSDEK